MLNNHNFPTWVSVISMILFVVLHTAVHGSLRRVCDSQTLTMKKGEPDCTHHTVILADREIDLGPGQPRTPTREED